MASSYKNSVFNLALGILASGAAAFAIFAMPADLLETLVGATGLPSLVSAAAPPLGATARLGIMAVLAALVFFLVWLALRALDPPQVGMSGVAVEDDDDWLAPRLRRADAHPDAPARRPLLAAEDLGEPIQQSYQRAEPAAPTAKSPESAQPVLQAASPVEEPLELEIGQIVDEDAQAAVELAVEASQGEDDRVEWDPAPLHLQPDNEDEGMSTEELLARLPLPEQESASVSSLLQRLNAGLADCEWPLPGAKSDDAQAQMDDRLRGVLQDLQKMAGGNA